MPRTSKKKVAAPKKSKEEQETKEEAPAESKEKKVAAPKKSEEKKIKDLTPEERNAQIQELKELNIQDHLSEERVKFESIVCEACGTKLGVEPDVFVVLGSSAKDYICPNPECQRITRVLSRYNSPPETDEAIIKTILYGPVWMETPIPQMEDESVLKLVEYHADMIKKNENNKVTEVEALILRNLDLINKKLFGK